MALEAATQIHQLDPANPAGPDRLASGDDHIRMIKLALKTTFPNITGPVTVTQEALNALAGLATPVGTISLWYGTAATIPAGYAVCDGSAAPKSDGTGTILTPDLRGRVPVGASEAHAPNALFGSNEKTVTSAGGGAHSHVGATEAGSGSHSHGVTVADTILTVAQIPNHSHGLRVFNRGDTDAPGGSAGSGDDTVSSGSGYIAGYVEGNGGGTGHSHGASLTPGDSSHAHPLTIEAVPAHSHSVVVDVVQASIALHYIMKV